VTTGEWHVKVWVHLSGSYIGLRCGPGCVLRTVILGTSPSPLISRYVSWNIILPPDAIILVLIYWLADVGAASSGALDPVHWCSGLGRRAISNLRPRDCTPLCVSLRDLHALVIDIRLIPRETGVAFSKSQISGRTSPSFKSSSMV
jgi:hypothetical protein